MVSVSDGWLDRSLGLGGSPLPPLERGVTSRFQVPLFKGDLGGANLAYRLLLKQNYQPSLRLSGVRKCSRW
ncbi:MAG: hypothetical protein DCF32_03215 [Leptolyngbya sp.]|nr:MAG: hypothetical protein DCF32_03215 [Leptolyngbya sp.]